MSSNINLTTITQPFSGFIRFVSKHHYIIFFCLLAIGFAYTVFSVNSIVNTPSDKEYRDSISAKTISNDFDQQTINKIKKLHFRDDAASVQLEQGRNNPFTE